MWESGRLGDPGLVYGVAPDELLGDLLANARLTADRLRSMRILEIGFGNGALLSELQKWSPHAYGIDLVDALESVSLRPHSTILGSLFEIPFMPGQFDLVICRGVIHHTDDARGAFDCMAEQVSEGGTCFLSLYEPGIKRTLSLRKLLPRSWSYPESVRLGISSVLGLPRAALECFRTRRFDSRSVARYHGNAKLGIFDVISPRWTSTHTSDEVIEWFTSRGLTVRRVWPGHYVGCRPN